MYCLTRSNLVVFFLLLWFCFVLFFKVIKKDTGPSCPPRKDGLKGEQGLTFESDTRFNYRKCARRKNRKKKIG